MTEDSPLSKLLNQIREVESLANDTDNYPSVRQVEERLTAVFQKDYDAQRFDILKQKMELLYKTNDKTKPPPDFSTPQALARKIKEVSKYFTLDRNTLRDNFKRGNDGKKELKNPSERFKNLLAIAYTDSLSFADYSRPPEGIEGDWVSVVRSNDSKSLLLAKIHLKKNQDHTYTVTMQGRNTLEGKGYEKNRCLQILFELENKTLLLSFFLGGIKMPELLQGTFSGISSVGVPIAGIEWLVRPSLLPKTLQVPDVIEVNAPNNIQWSNLPKEIKYGFKDFNDCYLKIKIDDIAHFNWKDVKADASPIDN